MVIELFAKPLDQSGDPLGRRGIYAQSLRRQPRIQKCDQRLLDFARPQPTRGEREEPGISRTHVGGLERRLHRRANGLLLQAPVRIDLEIGVELRVERIFDEKPAAIGMNRLHGEVIERTAQRVCARARPGQPWARSRCPSA